MKKKKLICMHKNLISLRAEALNTLEQCANEVTIDAREFDAMMIEQITAKILGVDSVSFRIKKCDR